MKSLITGVAGFVGNFIAHHLAEADPDSEIWGLVWNEDPRRPPAFVRPVNGDLADRASLHAALAASRPEIVYHLAAASSVASSWHHPHRHLEVNLAGSVNLFEAIGEVGLGSTVVLASSAEVYGSVPPDQQPITEDAPLRPLSPYGASKAALDMAAEQYTRLHDLPTIRLRLFHHTGPGRPPQFVASSFARQIARIEMGLEPPRLSVGNLDAIRDFTDVRDIARAYRLAAQHGKPGAAYNVCSGRGITIHQLLDRLLHLAGLEVEVIVDPDRLRANDIPQLVGDAGRFTGTTGWRPEIPLDDTLSDLLDWWRAELQH
jgi:GDP-4-dehydro-6-deoxy-D-mannose reductase